MRAIINKQSRTQGNMSKAKKKKPVKKRTAATIPLRKLDYGDREWDPGRWNGSELDNSVLAYRYPDGGGQYTIDLETSAVSSAYMLDAVLQVSDSQWANDECVAGLVYALSDVINPQAHLCGFGEDKRLDKKTIRMLVQGRG
jgi:hypothetical protein